MLRLHEIEAWGDSDTILEVVYQLARHFNLSLRQLERVYTNLAIIYGTLAQNDLRLVPIIVFVSVLKVVNASLFARLVERKVVLGRLLEELDLHAVDGSSRENERLVRVVDWIRYCVMSNSEFSKLDENDLLRNFGREFWRYNVDREEIISIYCRRLVMFSANF